MMQKKQVDQIFLNFHDLFIIGNYVQLGLKPGRDYATFSV